MHHLHDKKEVPFPTYNKFGDTKAPYVIPVMEAKGATNHAHELAQILGTNPKNPKNLLLLLI